MPTAILISQDKTSSGIFGAPARIACASINIARRHVSEIFPFAINSRANGIPARVGRDGPEVQMKIARPGADALAQRQSQSRARSLANGFRGIVESPR